MGEIAAPPGTRPVRWKSRGPLLAALALLAAAGCRDGAVPSRAAHAAEPPQASPASREAGGMEEVCEWAAWMVDDALAIEAEQAGGPISGLLGSRSAQGCRLTAVGSFVDLPEDVETPVDLLFEAFDDNGWQEDLRFAADTEESSAIGMWKGGILCVAGALWAAPGETEPEDYEPEDDGMRYDVAMECAPAESLPLLPGSFS